MLIQVLINASEKTLIPPLEAFFKNIYKEDQLISHGLDHHRRVWKYAKELLQCTEDKKNTYDQNFVQKLLIACYLHDIGMSADPGMMHGQYSRDICTRFLKKQNLEKSDYIEVLTAIENHDNKDYKNPVVQNMLQTILSVADDLDAFGYIGIYRYIEIYCLRGISFPLLGQKITENAKKRFTNFTSVFGQLPELIEKHRKRYNCLLIFFEGFNNQVINYRLSTRNPYGYCGVVEILSGICSGDAPFRSVIPDSLKHSNDTIIKVFFEQLEQELKN